MVWLNILLKFIKEYADIVAFVALGLSVFSFTNWVLQRRPRIKIKVRLENVRNDYPDDDNVADGIVIRIKNVKTGQTVINTIEFRLTNDEYFLLYSQNNSNLHEPFNMKEERRYPVKIDNLKRAITNKSGNKINISGIRVTYYNTRVKNVKIPNNIRKEFANCNV